MYRWVIADGFLPASSSGMFESHESLCLVNPHNRDAEVVLHVFFEDRPPLEGIMLTCPAKRTRHIRVNTLHDAAGRTIPVGQPYALELVCDVELGVQLSRLDTSQAQMALMTVAGIRID